MTHCINAGSTCDKAVLTTKINQPVMITNQIIEDALSEIHKKGNYFEEGNREWKHLTTKMNLMEDSEVAPVSYLQELAILDENGNVNPLLKNWALFIRLDVDEPIDYSITKTEILVSPMGLEFLRIMTRKLNQQKGGYNFG